MVWGSLISCQVFLGLFVGVIEINAVFAHILPFVALEDSHYALYLLVLLSVILILLLLFVIFVHWLELRVELELQLAL